MRNSFYYYLDLSGLIISLGHLTYLDFLFRFFKMVRKLFLNFISMNNLFIYLHIALVTVSVL